MDTVPPVPSPDGRHWRVPRPFRRDRNRGHSSTGTGGHGSSGSSSSSPENPQHDSDRLLWAVIWILTGVSAWIAASGQVETWTWAGLNPTDPRRFGLPFDAELTVVGWLLLGRFAVRRGRSPYPWWAMAALFAALAVYMNAVHGGWRQALIFATASAANLSLWFAKFYIDYIGSQVSTQLRDGTRPKILGLGSLFQARVDFRGFLLVRRYSQIVTVGEGRRLAELWLEVCDDTKEYLKNPKDSEGKPVPDEKLGFWDRRKVAKRTAYNSVKLQLGVPVIVPKGVQIAKVTFARPDPEPLTVPQTWPGAAPVSAPPAPAAPRAQAPKPPAPAAPAPVKPVTAPVVETVPEEWFDQHAERITRAQDNHPDWATRALTVDDVQKVPGCGNRQVAGQVRKCLNVLRQSLTPAGTTPPPTAPEGDVT